MSEITPLIIDQPHHSYLRVPGWAIEVIYKAYGWQPSEYSFQSAKREAVFLEEDCDMPEFAQHSGLDLNTVPLKHFDSTRALGRPYEPLGS